MNTCVWNNQWNTTFDSLAIEKYRESDAAHDIYHVRRVVNLTYFLAQEEKANLDIALPAAWLHDIVKVDKKSWEARTQASRLSASYAQELLTHLDYPDEGRHSAISHAIETHSFSANISPETIEAMIVQDADRLDALGAIGVLRMAVTGGTSKTPYLYCADDIFGENRFLDDETFICDHLWKKLLKLPEKLHTSAAKHIAHERLATMKIFINALAAEVTLYSFE
jgi:uncharacterized protein